MLSIGHRGAAGHVTENTLPSIRKAVELGADIVEVDVQRTKDGHLVLFHDKLLDRLADLGGYLSSHSYEQLRNATLRGGHRIPSLAEACDVVAASRSSLLVEIISPGAEDETAELLSRRLQRRQFAIGSFFHAALRDLKRVRGELTTVALIEGIPVGLEAVIRDSLCDFAGFAFDSILPSAVSTAQRLGAGALVWTVDDPREIARAHRLGVDGIVTNFPERVASLK